MELATGVYSIPQTIDGNGATQTIHPAAVETPDGLILVDVGFEGLEHKLASELDSIGHGWEDVTKIIITHQDSDHAGGLSAVVDRTGATVYAHERCAPYLDGRKEPAKSPAGERYPAVAVDEELIDGMTFETTAGPMEVVYTPGHTDGHVSLFFPDEYLLLAADALTADDEGLQGPSNQYTLDMEEALDSATTLADLAVEKTLCYHGGFVDEGSDRIAELIVELE